MIAWIFTIFMSSAMMLVATEKDASSGQTEAVRRLRGQGEVKLAQLTNGAWTLLVGGKPYVVRAIEYGVDKIGTMPPLMNQWMKDDDNQNGKPDGPYDSWVDSNGNGKQDPNEPTKGDFALLRDMGCNTIRIYHPDNLNKDVLRDLTKTYGIRVIMGNFLGAYGLGSGASATEGTDYTDTNQRQKMLEGVKAMVQEHKNEPYVLIWMLGNENDVEGSKDNSTFNNTNARSEPEAYAKFVNEVAEWIHENDPNHPVGVCNATNALLPYYKKYSPALDIIGMNSYAGGYGFGSLWSRIKNQVDRPVLITEFGADAYDQKKGAVDEDAQARYHSGCWRDIMNNSYSGNGAGNALGGVVFQWIDKWWYSGSSSEQDTTLGAWAGAAPDGWYNNEWLGITSFGTKDSPPTLRHLRAAYRAYQEMWVHDNFNAYPPNAKKGRPIN